MADHREVIDIEPLLIRAYREKRVDRYGQDGKAAGAVALGLGAGPRAPGSQLGGPERVDTSSYAANSAARTREAFLRLAGTADGLLALHDAVLALPDMYVDYGAGADYLVWDVETAARLGHRITVTGERATIQAVRRRGGRGAGRDDLLPVDEPRAVTRVVTSVLMIRHGREMSRPDLSDIVETKRPVYAGPNSRRVVSHEIEYQPSLDLVARERATYAVWHAALGLLVAARRACADYAITGPHAPATPWERSGGTVYPAMPSHKLLQVREKSKAPPARKRAA